jgi:hypothetical protein
LAASRSTSFIPHFLLFFPLPFFLLAGDIGQMNLPVGMKDLDLGWTKVTGKAESE